MSWTGSLDGLVGGCLARRGAPWVWQCWADGHGQSMPTWSQPRARRGQVVWYTSLIVGMVVRPMVQAFEAKFPGIKVAFVPVPWQEAVVRLTTEARSGGPKGDVVDGGNTVYPLRDAGLAESYKPKEAEVYPAEFKDSEGYWTGMSLQYLVAAVNTDMVGAKEVPQTYQDLLDPKWMGKIAWTNSPSTGGPPGFIGNILEAMGPEKGAQYLDRLATQQVANVPANQRVVLDQCIAGQYPLVLSVMNFHAAASIADGAPVRWLKLPPVLQTCNTIGIIKGSPHPAAARLFVEYMLSKEGQEVYRKAGYIPAHPDVPAPEPDLKPDIGKFAVNTITPSSYHASEAVWMDIYKRKFQ